MLPKRSYDYQLPCSEEELAERREAAWALDLPRLKLNERKLTIIANGPSASEVTPRGDTLAVNGALALCLARGFAPDFWMAIDPQPLVMNFLAEAPPSTTYLLASQLHGSVFGRLRKHRTLIFDLGSDIPEASSVTLVALLTACRLGYSRIEIWGWDLCVLDGRSHAHGAITPETHRFEIGPDVGEALAVFETTPTWEAEAYQAVNLIKSLRVAGVRVKVHGPGLLATGLSLEGINDD